MLTEAWHDRPDYAQNRYSSVLMQPAKAWIQFRTYPTHVPSGPIGCICYFMGLNLANDEVPSHVSALNGYLSISKGALYWGRMQQSWWWRLLARYRLFLIGLKYFLHVNKQFLPHPHAWNITLRFILHPSLFVSGCHNRWWHLLNRDHNVRCRLGHVKKSTQVSNTVISWESDPRSPPVSSPVKFFIGLVTKMMIEQSVKGIS